MINKQRALTELPLLCNALIADVAPNGTINSYQEVIFMHNTTIEVVKSYEVSRLEYLNVLNILSLDDGESIRDGSIISIHWEGHLFAVMTATTYNHYYWRV